MTSILITMGESHGKYEPPPEIGIKRKMIPIDDASTPNQSIRATFPQKLPFPALFGIRKYPMTAEHAASGEISQKKPRHVDRMMKAAAMNGPMTFPKPNAAPSIPWYFPRLSNVTISETMIMVREVTPPPAIPAKPRKA